MGSVLAGLDTMNKDAHGLNDCRQDTEWPKTRRASVLFTREESARIIAATRAYGFTLTHVGA
ncbi:hypothetical protein AZE42_05582 [Rhizopogon vesiculosus]|uniref:Uncharacterized protein n=1 Tax=Rhizopogon vesiculosus TaxID=180088 RepID=A0A1J8Q555_9AGAM|nr:hypothetical protein AZE42_05582 [Rhizopogon vesiculosus]